MVVVDLDRSENVSLFRAWGRFEAERQIRVDVTEAHHCRSDLWAMLGTVARRVPEIPGLDATPWLDNGCESVELTDVPEPYLVILGGTLLDALEFGQHRPEIRECAGHVCSRALRDLRLVFLRRCTMGAEESHQGDSRTRGHRAIMLDSQPR